MHVKRHFERVKTALLAFRAQVFKRSLPCIAAFFGLEHLKTRDANWFMAGEFRRIGLATSRTKELAHGLNLKAKFFEPTPHIDRRNTQFPRYLRDAQTALNECAQFRFVGRTNQFAHTPILN